MKLDQDVASMKSSTNTKIGHVGSKTRSLGQILQKPSVRSRGHIFSPIHMIDLMVLYAAFNSISVISRPQFTLFMSFLGFTSTRLGL